MAKDPIICTYPKKITVSHLEKIIRSKDEKDKLDLILVIEHRLSRRFFKVIDKADKDDLSSFMTMAICCFVIETLECFHLGKKNTKKRGAGRKVFESFFKRENSDFPGLLAKSDDFYDNVRCGLLHQAETMNGWFLNKTGKLLEIQHGIKTINGEHFLKSTKKAVENYLRLLKSKNLNDHEWNLAFVKLQDICDNCKELKKY